MPTFAFQARDSRGAPVEGTRDAPDQRTALTALREAGFFVTKLAPVSGAKAKTLARESAQNASPGATQNPTTNNAVANGAAPNGVSANNLSANSASTSGVLINGASQNNASAAGVSTAGASASGEAPRRLNVGEVSTEKTRSPQEPAPSVSPDIEYSKRNVPSPATTPNVAVPPASGKDLWAFANAKELSLFFRQMHSMLNSGTSVSRALQVYGEHASNRGLKRAALQMSRETGEGRPFSEAMRSYPGLFSVLMISMTGAGERGGRLDQICNRLADYSERDFELSQTVKRETFYPKILLVCAILIPSVPIWYLRGLSAYLHSVVPPLAVIGMIYVAFRIFNRALLITGREGPFRLGLDALKMNVPGVSKVVRSLATAKFARALGAMYASGVGAEYAMRISGESCGNAWVQRRISQVAPGLTQGASFTESMKKTGQFPPIAIQMMATGEESGAIDTQLEKVALFLENEAEAAIRNAVKILGVVVFLLMAVYIASIVIGVFSGYANGISDLADGKIPG